VTKALRAPPDSPFLGRAGAQAVVLREPFFPSRQPRFDQSIMHLSFAVLWEGIPALRYHRFEPRNEGHLNSWLILLALFKIFCFVAQLVNALRIPFII
jgi:hypothetical protein